MPSMVNFFFHSNAELVAGHHNESFEVEFDSPKVTGGYSITVPQELLTLLSEDLGEENEVYSISYLFRDINPLFNDK